MYNRYDNGKDLIHLEFPKLISFGTWCTCREIISEVLLQARHFISYYTARGGELSRNMTVIFPKKELRLNLSQINISELPFKIILIDTSTNQCAICSSKQLEEKSNKVCSGCPIPNENIIIKKILKYFCNLSICLDWTDIKQYGVQEEAEDPSIKFVTTQSHTLHDCLKLHFTPVLSLEVNYRK